MCAVTLANRDGGDGGGARATITLRMLWHVYGLQQQEEEEQQQQQHEEECTGAV